MPVGLRSQDLPRETTSGDLDVEIEIDREVVDLGGGIGKRICVLRVKTEVIDIWYIVGRVCVPYLDVYGSSTER